MLKTFRKTNHYRKMTQTWQTKYDAGAPKQGDPAPDFELWDANGEHSVRLSGFQNKKPVALVFGSFT
jgi:peroxiredoxin